MHALADRSARDRCELPLFEEGGVCGALGRLMAAVRGEGRELLLCCGPALLLPHACRQDEERFSIERREGFRLVEDRAQPQELIVMARSSRGEE